MGSMSERRLECNSAIVTQSVHNLFVGHLLKQTDINFK